MASVTGSNTEEVHILLVNPNATSFMTEKCLSAVKDKLPMNVTVHGFTAPKPAPSAIEGHLDAVLSAAASVRAIVPMAKDYDAILVACFSDHPLTRALREEIVQPVAGIMEASLYTARLLGGRFGIVATNPRSVVMHEDAVRNYGLAGFCAGVATTGLAVLELETRPLTEVLHLMGKAALGLVEKGADTLCLGCAGMAEMTRAVEEAVGDDVRVLDGVDCGVHMLTALVRMKQNTAKSGVYKDAAKGRAGRGQDYL